MEDVVRQIQALAGDCGAVPVWSLSDEGLLTSLDGVHAAEQALAAVKLHLVRQAEARDLPGAEHAPTCAVWLRHRLRISIQAAKRLVELAREVDRRPVLDEALSAGVVNTEQAQVIATTVKELPARIGAEAVDKAETMLIDYATQFEPLGLRKLAARILTHVAPEVAEEAEAAALARQEARARTSRGFTLTPMRDGRVRVSGWLDRESAAVINAALDPLCDPARLRQSAQQTAGDQHGASTGDQPDPAGRRLAEPVPGINQEQASSNRQDAASHGDGQGLDGNGPGLDRDMARMLRDEPTPTQPRTDAPSHEDRQRLDRNGPEMAGDDARMLRDERTPAQRRVDALVEVCRFVLAGGQLPDNGGDRPQVVVTVPFDVLRQRLGTATLDTGEPLSATQVRRLACDAQILPAVLGGDGQVLDMGASRRLFSGPLRRALVLRDGGCAFPGCDRHARWSEGHHIRHWSQGGSTTLDNGVLLCGHHHRVIHQGDWMVRMGHDRRPEFLPPTYIDPDRKPRRNIYHRLVVANVQ